MTGNYSELSLNSMSRTAEIVNGSIVLIGHFAPGGITANWLFNNKLIGEVDLKETEDSNESVTSSRLTKIESNTFILQITENRMLFISKDVLRPSLKDMAVGVISLLGRVKITAIGLNFMSHFKMVDDDQYHLIGDTLAPKDHWMKVFGDYEGWSSGLSELSIKMQAGPRNVNDLNVNGISLKLQPSAKITRGIFLTYNNHSDVPDDCVHSDEFALKFINENWDKDCQESNRVFVDLLDGILR